MECYSELNDEYDKSGLTIHLDATFPFIYLLCISSFDGTARERRLWCWGIPRRRKELDIDLGDQGQRGYLRLES